MPFQILQIIGKVAYRLQLPASAQIHYVFHVSQLKPATSTRPANPSITPQWTSVLVLNVQPAALLGIHNTVSEVQVLIGGEGLPEWEATWEDFQQINGLFPDFYLEYKVSVWAGVMQGT